MDTLASVITRERFSLQSSRLARRIGKLMQRSKLCKVSLQLRKAAMETMAGHYGGSAEQRRDWKLDLKTGANLVEEMNACVNFANIMAMRPRLTAFRRRCMQTRCKTSTRAASKVAQMWGKRVIALAPTDETTDPV
jgi:hypothetical protein